MKNRFALFGILLAGTLVLSACAGPILWFIPVSSETSNDSAGGAPIEVVETLPPQADSSSGDEVESGVEVIAEPEVQTQFSFEPAEYLDEEAGFKLYFPVDWTVLPREQVGERGSQAALLSPGSTLEQIAMDGSRITLMIYKWDPKEDLVAFVNQRELAWEASGFSAIRNGNFTLEDGREVVLYDVKTVDGIDLLVAFTIVGEEYLQITSEGNLDLCKEIIRSLSIE